jgi:hypothetical protein
VFFNAAFSVLSQKFLVQKIRIGPQKFSGYSDFFFLIEAENKNLLRVRMRRGF